jgi:phosphoribosylaminoimidazolecarboxamide formyltransferase / IMP cyclohydrolase
MNKTNKKKNLRILISVFNKKRLSKFLKGLENLFSLEIVATSSTAAYIKRAGFKVFEVSKVTGFPEILSGRVKTLHPKIHAAILADKKNKKHKGELQSLGIKAFDMVVVNLYPFLKTIKDKNVSSNSALEQIDIGGVALLRAAAKNFQSVIVVSSVKDYVKVLTYLNSSRKKDLSFKQRKSLAQKTFKLTCFYDKHISRFLNRT